MKFDAPNAKLPSCQRQFADMHLLQHWQSMLLFITILSVLISDSYNDFIVSLHFRLLPNFRWCTAPGCRSGQVHTAGKKSPRMTCVKCKTDSCFTHQQPWIEGDREDQHTQLKCSLVLGNEIAVVRNDEDIASRARISRTTKACPNCGIRIHKSGGCSSVICEYFLLPSSLVHPLLNKIC